MFVSELRESNASARVIEWEETRLWSEKQRRMNETFRWSEQTTNHKSVASRDQSNVKTWSKIIVLIFYDLNGLFWLFGHFKTLSKVENYLHLQLIAQDKFLIFISMNWRTVASVLEHEIFFNLYTLLIKYKEHIFLQWINCSIYF